MNDDRQAPAADSTTLSPSKRPSWDTVVLVCKDCRKRRNGPAKLKAKDIVGALRRASRDLKPRPRMLVTGCLGLCPKAATAVAMVGADVVPRVVAMRSRPESRQLVALLQRSAADASLSGDAD